MKNFSIDYIDLNEVRENNIIVSNSINILSNYYYELQKIINPNCFFEVGAFEASFSRKMHEIFSFSEIWAFEANPYNFQYYKDLNDDINYLNLAISNTNGTVNFYLQDKNLNDGLEIEKIRGNNSILNRNDLTISYKDIEVKSTSLDSFIENKNLTDKIFSLWIDVEGANKNVLLGFERYIENAISILIEVEECEYWQNQWLCNDVCCFLKTKNFIPILRDFEDNQQYNVVFINKKITKNKLITNKIKNLIYDYFNNLELEVIDIIN